jgi:hypothetical protein
MNTAVWYSCLRDWNKASLTLLQSRKQKYQNGSIHRKLRVPTSEREGKLSNPRASARRARAMHWENLWKFTETRARPLPLHYALISSWPSIQYYSTFTAAHTVAANLKFYAKFSTRVCTAVYTRLLHSWLRKRQCIACAGGPRAFP